jgi:predicted dithiol-disulfide oxidoreductase (DUF899 family)
MTISATTKPASARHPIVSHETWTTARKKLLAAEKELTQRRDELARQRRELPWEKVGKVYTFDTPAGKKTLAELFGSHSQLIVYHFMLGPDWEEGCPGCSFVSDHFDGALAHLAARDVAFTAVSRAPLAQIEAFKQRMGWHFDWVSSHGSDFNFDFGVSFTPEQSAAGKVSYNYTDQEFSHDEAPGMSVFLRTEDGSIYHTYSTYGRGLDPLIGAYQLLDLVPKGRDEDDLATPMEWVRHHDRYGREPLVDVQQQLAHANDPHACCESQGSKS